MKAWECYALHEPFRTFNITGVVATLTDPHFKKIESKNYCDYDAQGEEKRQAFLKELVNGLE